MNLGDLALGTQLIRPRDFEREAPSVSSVGLVSGLSSTGPMAR
ncbi:hypothetical protein [Nocardioides yefusunii]|uniref:Uncharacterized protein n=1 Tax=Nocardioides yefusunii TaxID=2500546 RepID=A0ABW1QT55_9ACTN|nr:hypothetical protein [Nocardioides yefusunii]